MSTASRRLSHRLLTGTRWSYATVFVGLLFGPVQALHTVGMLRFGLVGAVLEGVVPLAFTLGLAVSGPVLQYWGFTRSEQKRVVGWMALVGVVSALLFLWALSHQVIVAGEYLASSSTGSESAVNYGSAYESSASAGADGDDSGFSQYASGGVFPHAKFVTATNLTAGALLGFLLGVYNVRSRRHYRAAQAERERVSQQRTRLSVLNRVLRHNLRNDANVILMSLRQIGTQADGQLADYADMAADKTTDLVALGEKARQIDATIGDDVTFTDEVELRTTVEDVIDSVSSEGTSVEWTVRIPEAIELTTNEHLLARVLDELIANAIQHGTRDHIRMRITAERDTEGWIDLLVEDDGPGIPEQERVSLEADEETALDHASGLGLWLVQWTVTSLGGDVTYEESEWGGTAVRIRLPVTPDDALTTGGRDGPAPAGQAVASVDRAMSPTQD